MLEDRTIEWVDFDRLARDVSTMVQVPSVTGDERAAFEHLEALASAYGLETRLAEFDLNELSTARGYPGSLAERSHLYGLSITLRGRDPMAPRFLLNGHLDVVPPGDSHWKSDPWSGLIENGRVYGRGSVDMKGGVTAALHAMAAVKQVCGGVAGDIVLQAVASEEDGGQGAFGALEQDADFAACLIPEPSGMDVVCAHAGSIQFVGRVRGRATHAATRLAGMSAIDRYLPLHLAMQEYEQKLNRNISHELMRQLELPYPIVVGALSAGRWASQVPDELTFYGRLGVRIEREVAQEWDNFATAIREAADEAGTSLLELRAHSSYRPSATPQTHPLVRLAREALSEDLERPARLSGVPWGADMQHVVARDIPCVMVGTTGIERAHATDEYVEVDELLSVARTIVRILLRFQNLHVT